MPRNNDARTDGALNEVTTLVPGSKGTKIQQILTDWANGKGKGVVGKSIKLGGKLHSTEEKEARAQVRAVLLGAQCFAGYDPKSQPYKNYIKQISGEASTALGKRLTDFYDAWWRFQVLSSNPLGIEYAPSFDQAPDEVRWNCQQACAQVFTIVRAAHDDLTKAISGANDSVLRYEYWFGAMDGGRPAKVKSNFFALLEALTTQKLVLYYRGPLRQKTMAIRDDYDMTAGSLPAGGEGYCGMSVRRSKQNLTCPSGLDLHIKLGNGVVLRGCLTPTKGKNTYAGTIVHEMSHIVCETRDVKAREAGSGALYDSKTRQRTNLTVGKNVPTQDSDGAFVQSYGADWCAYMAQHWPDKAIANADNYCYFAEQWLA